MTTHRNYFIIMVAVAFFFSACASNLENLKKQAEDNRVLGEEYLLQKSYTAALKYLLIAEGQYPGNAELQRDLGDAYMGKGRNDLAIRHYLKAIDLNPELSQAKNNLGVAYMKMGKWDEAIDVFLALTEDLLYPTPHYPLFNLGWAYYNQKDLPLSEKFYLEALKLHPNFVLALRGLGLTYMAMGKGEGAVNVLHKAVSLAPQTARLHFDLATAHGLSGDNENAIKSYQKVIELAPPDSRMAIEAKMAIEQIR